MSEKVQTRILQNQIEIMWTLNLLMGKICPELVGRNGELDNMRADLAQACKASRNILEQKV